jgi:hypothetical protein
VTELAARDLDRLASLAALHDLGKVNHGFQANALPASAPEPRCGHVAPSPLSSTRPTVGLTVPGYRRVGEAELLPEPTGRWPGRIVVDDLTWPAFL